MITRLRVDQASAIAEFGIRCQRVIPWDEADEPPFGAMVLWMDGGGKSGVDYHTQREIIMGLSGSGILHMEGHEDTPFSPGDVLVCPNRRKHYVTNPSSEALSFLSLYWPIHEILDEEQT